MSFSVVKFLFVQLLGAAHLSPMPLAW